MRLMMALLIAAGVMSSMVAAATSTPQHSNFVIAVALQDSQAAPQQSPAQTPQAEPQKPQQEPSGQINVDIDTHRSSSAWWANPMWIGIGAVALIALVAVIIAASRGGGTTVVRG